GGSKGGDRVVAEKPHDRIHHDVVAHHDPGFGHHGRQIRQPRARVQGDEDRKSTRLNSSHLGNSYAVFCLKKKTSVITNVSRCFPRTWSYSSTAHGRLPARLCPPSSITFFSAA